MWFTETPWPPISILAVVACILVAAWMINARRAYLIGILSCVLLSGVIYLIEQAIETTAERLEANIYELTDAFQQKRVDDTLAFFSASDIKDRLLVTWAIATVTVEDDLDVSDVQVEMMADETLAKVHFRANATINFPMYSGRAPSRWRLTWRKEGEAWKIIEVERLHITQDRVLPVQNATE